MIVDVVMPKLGESITEGTIVKWRKQRGAAVQKDEIILEISTDKVESEIPSPVTGVMAEILAKENDTVEVDTVIARIDTTGLVETGELQIALESQTEFDTEVPVPEDKPGKHQVPAESGRFFSPLVLKIARTEGIDMDDLAKISGSGLSGRVTKKDVLNFIEEKKQAKKKPGTVAKSPEQKKTPEIKDLEIIPMDAIRRQIAHHMRMSLDTSAHVYIVSACDVTRIMNYINKRRDAFEKEEGFKFTFNPFILQAVVKAVGDYPRINSSVEGDNIIQKRHINIGMAVATESGLMVPVIKHAEEKGLIGLARAANDLIIRVRYKKLVPDDVQEATFSVTNFGVFGNVMGFPIINQPNVAILGVGTVKKQPVVLETPDGDMIAIRSMVYLSLSFDHRIIDGDLGGKFLQRAVYYLENFTTNE